MFRAGFKRFWNHPAGPKTVHFWAPAMKWTLVLSGIGDYARSPEYLSIRQYAALCATGAIWTRWSLIVRPKNYFNATVNFFLAIVGAVQVSRILVYQRQQKRITAQSEQRTELARSLAA
ncbi:Mitochondrial pyruvate carrier [Schizosaccharomyces pombe]|uniref:Probable mitochondrial pyruvate carrier 2 n=1 Tax=Schizosaccharomyces pombe (strain 972 / ATCC 24843) TaxID=284812 RepID=MPC2_SCHPO|nr:putative BRP44L family protein [Schizosaccharomyces pombe]Q09896.1 RecName: Full=Probable mitochondrial pyruvate carrier 2; Short=MPC2 [Schizosaccharomyces pombe 972h-]CAA91774.1 mitochondrial protein, predicted, human BRP44 ortholog [Schizosaccharomyces pombe]|eukprot:NP_592846.1 putative BRP44L family protein [Schizosaccharomyces pombe]